MKAKRNSSESFLDKKASYEVLPDALQLTSQYWLAHKGRFPILSHLARIDFVVLAASLKSECVFSAAENTVTQNRASLNSEKVKECVIVRYKVMGLRKIIAKVPCHFFNK